MYYCYFYNVISCITVDEQLNTTVDVVKHDDIANVIDSRDVASESTDTTKFESTIVYLQDDTRDVAIGVNVKPAQVAINDNIESAIVVTSVETTQDTVDIVSVVTLVDKALDQNDESTIDVLCVEKCSIQDTTVTSDILVIEADSANVKILCTGDVICGIADKVDTVSIDVENTTAHIECDLEVHSHVDVTVLIINDEVTAINTVLIDDVNAIIESSVQAKKGTAASIDNTCVQAENSTAPVYFCPPTFTASDIVKSTMKTDDFKTCSTCIKKFSLTRHRHTCKYAKKLPFI